MSSESDLSELSDPLRELRVRFDAFTARHRSALWRYCLRLTGSAWDAEDLVQETLLKAFARLPNLWQPMDARSYLFRIATNAWIDARRRLWREAEPPEDLPEPSTGEAPDPAEMRDAMERLVAVLPPRQRVVFLLTEAFDFRAAEVAAMIGATEGAVKAALHRARTTLRRAIARQPDGAVATATGERDRAVEVASSPSAPDAVVARYVDAFNRRDPDAIVALLDEAACVEIVGDGEEHGREVSRRNSLAEWAADPRPQWVEAGVFEGRDVLFVYGRTLEDPKVLIFVTTLETDGGRITRQRLYYFCPELIAHIAERLGVPALTHGYRYVPPDAGVPAGA